MYITEITNIYEDSPRKMNAIRRQDFYSKSDFQQCTISIGNVENHIAKYEGLLVHMRAAIGELWAVEDRARLTISQLLRRHQWGSEMKMATLEQLINSSFMEASVEIAKEAGDGRKPIDKRVWQQMVRRYLGNLKTMVRNNYTRVLAKRIRRLLDAREAYKCRPVYFVIKLLLGPRGNWKGIFAVSFVLNFAIFTLNAQFPVERSPPSDLTTATQTKMTRQKQTRKPWVMM
jgi:hypothetical protein